MKFINRDFADLVFRILFCLIFIALGGEHLFKDDLIQKLMPSWVPAPRLVSIACGLILLSGGGLIALGYQLRFAALMLGAFLIIVTAVVHGPALFSTPEFIDSESEWLWVILQRSNYVKNICLLGLTLLVVTLLIGMVTGFDHTIVSVCLGLSVSTVLVGLMPFLAYKHFEQQNSH